MSYRIVGTAKIPCPHCGNSISLIEKISGTRGTYYSCHCTKCKRATLGVVKSMREIRTAEKPIVECPYCHSTNTQKISTASKVVGVATFGIVGLGKATKEWHCNNCKSNF